MQERPFRFALPTTAPRRRRRDRLAQEIDRKIGGNGKFDPADRSENDAIHGEIGKVHQDRPADRAAGPKEVTAIRPTENGTLTRQLDQLSPELGRERRLSRMS